MYAVYFSSDHAIPVCWAAASGSGSFATLKAAERKAHRERAARAKSGVLDRVFERLQHAQIVRIKIDAVSMDSTIVKVHPDGTGLRGR